MINAKFINNTNIKLSDAVLQIMGSSRDGQIYELGMVQDFYNRLMSRGTTNPVFFDIGANTGSYALIPHVNKNITCYAFEPNITAFNVLSENVKLNNLDNVICNNIGIWSGDTNLELKIPIDSSDSGLSTFGDNPTRFKYGNKSGKYKMEKVICKTIDNLVDEYNLEYLDGIKIDTEGAELSILKGGAKTLQNKKPLLLLEYDDKNTTQFGYNRTDIVDLLKSYGYTQFVMYGLSDIFVF